MSKPPFRHVELIEPTVALEERPDGSMILRSGYDLEPYDDNILQYLERWAGAAPDRVFLAQRGPDRAWRELTYADAWSRTRAIAQALLDRSFGPEKPVMILSGNSIEHALMSFGAMLAGAPVAPVSVAYSLLSKDHGKLRHVFSLVEPAMIFVQAVGPFTPALQALDVDGVELVAAGEASNALPSTPLTELLAAEPGADVDAAYGRLGPDTVAKYLFTSGSTGMPKGVINTHRMMCANQQMARQVAPPDPDVPPVVVDWLPWNHTFGGNMNVNGVMSLGGTLYIDAGRPLPGMFEESLANLREISPTYYANVPAGFAMLVAEMERDPALAETFFKRLQRLGYGGAALPQELHDRIQDVAVKTCGERILFSTGWGATETAPTVTSTYFETDRVGLLGLPYPGAELKLVPNGPKLEVRVRGPIVTPGYLKRPDLTAEAFDEDGFYRIGDAARFVDPEDPVKGLVFDGRVAEDFKLTTGTWVNVGPLRIAALNAAAPLIQDAVVTGHDREFIGLLAWPNVAAAKEICTDPAGNDSTEVLLNAPEVRAHLKAGLAQHNATHSGSSTRIARVLLLAEPPSVDAHEITDKGYINQAAVLARRADLVDRLYADPPAGDVIVVDA